MRRFLIFILIISSVLPLSAQSRNRGTSVKKPATSTKKTTQPQKKPAAKKVDRKTQLKNEKAAAQKARQMSQAQLAQLNKNVKASLDSVLILDNQIGLQQASIDSLNKDIVLLDAKIDTLSSQLTALQRELEIKKKRYAKAMVYMRKNKSVQNKLMFIFSANNFTQMMRRLRYMKEYSTFQKAQGELLKEKQLEVKRKQNELLSAKTQKESTLHIVEERKSSLQTMKTNCQTQVNYLNKNISTVQQQIKAYQQREAALNAEIDRIIQAEIEAARRAEAERRRKAEEARKKAESKSNNAKTTEKERKEERSEVEAWKADTAADTKLSNNFVSNKGRLPMPVTGSYSIVGHYGIYNVAGLKGVTLNNSGIDIRGQQGCSARAVFDGVVSQVFNYGGVFTVMLRHGSYISVYSGLSSSSVRKDQKVKALDNLGAVAKDSDGHYTLQFQLRNGSSRLNPEQWVRK